MYKRVILQTKSFRSIPKGSFRYKEWAYLQKRTFLTDDYKCVETWNSHKSTPILTKINIHDFYNSLDQNFTSKGVISAIDVDIFANSLRDPAYLEELKDLLHKLRLSAETGNTLESTHHATIRNFIEFGHIQELIDILKDPLNFGVFLDNYSANILLDNLITGNDYVNAAQVASVVMLQEDYSNDITCALCQYAAYKFITSYVPAPPPPPEEKPKKVEELKIRIKYLRNPYFDDHFDITDPLHQAGKTLAWTAERNSDNLSLNLQLLGWLFYEKYDKLLSYCESKSKSFKIFSEITDILKKKSEGEEGDNKGKLEKCLSELSKVTVVGSPLEDALKDAIENAINKIQNQDIQHQRQLFNTWTKVRETKLEEQTARLDRAKRMQQIQEKQEQLKVEEQKLWFFEKEEEIDLEIEEKEKLVEAPTKKKSIDKTDEDYIPPEILPKRR